ncbi:MAG TPA: error-prone DNA polymerase [Vicinamibacteria bacterium]|nr:error-prone DNA polymerase [Vicinamibacteria bacterium]
MPVELHTSSAFSFLRASSLPEDLVERAARLGYTAVALVDRDGVSGAPRFFKAARASGLRPIVGAALSLDGGGALPLLVETQRGYRNLCRLITRMKAGVPKGEGRLHLGMLEGLVEGLVALPGVDTLAGSCAQPAAGRLPLSTDRLARIVDAFGPGRVLLDVQRHRRREQEAANQALLDLGDALGLRAVATNGVRHAAPKGRALLDVLTCIREKRTLATAGRLLAENAERHLKAPKAMAALFADRPDLLGNAEALAERLSFTLEDLGYRFPDYPVPEGETQFSFLCKATEAGARERYRPYHEKARRQIERELALIGKLNLAGYFLIVWDLVNFCRREDILAQGRGSAANSAVCYSLGITAVDPVGMELLFERFLSEERGEWPDIDLDLPSGDRRERVIQHVYERYGAAGAAMTANVITYRDRSASREIGKVLGIPEDEIDRLAQHMRRFEFVDADDTLESRLERAGLDRGDRRIALFARLFEEIQDLPRHLGQHSGGMVVAQGRLDEVVPLEPASMPGRVIVQWDKEDCADLGIIKVDLLGLGMMSALQDALALLRGTGVEVDLAHLPPDDPKVYAMLRKADTVGVFQVESRAQMATLPRMKPDHFYDLVVEVAIIRPGPIVGKMVHPYLRRRNGEEPVGYLHPSLEPILKRTLGVPLFQEQLLRIAMTVAGFTGGEAEELRRAMGFKRSEKRMKAIEARLRSGMAERGITGAAADTIVLSISSFALYGFPESHAASFALIAYASAFLKCHHPAAFTCALLNNQPMGFYHPFTLVKDAQRHGVRFRPVDVTRSGCFCGLEEGEVRLGLGYVRGLRGEAAERIEGERALRPFASLQDFVDRTGLRRDEQRNLAEVGALNAFGLTRRSALWQVEKGPRGALFRDVAPRDLRNAPGGAGDSPLPEMAFPERLASDLAGTGLTVGPHPVSLYRAELHERGVRRAVELPRLADGERVRVAGAVICRQRPGTAAGFLFLTLEDETGLVNVIVRPDLFHREHAVLVGEAVLEVDGVLQATDGLSVRAFAVRKALAGVPATPARNFH